MLYYWFQALGAGFAYHHPAVLPLSQTVRQNPDWFMDSNVTWVGEVPHDPLLGVYIDLYLLFMLGGIPWQVNWTLHCRQMSVMASQTTSNSAVFSTDVSFEQQ